MAASAIDVRALSERLAPYIRRTPLLPAPGGGWLKLESLQPTSSFKVRGFFAAALALEPRSLRRGLLTVSAGNAALACAHVARTLGVTCRVVMFDTAPQLKVDGVRALGGDIIFKKREALYEWMNTRGWETEREVFIHPFADDLVIAGHASLAVELVDDCPELDRVFVPVGGGGLISGIASGLAGLSRDVAVVGVQSDGYPLWPRAFEAGGPVQLVPETIADGTTAPFDAAMFDRLRDAVDEWVVVPEADLRDAVVRLLARSKIVAEGAGALAYAAMSAGGAADTSVAVVSGGNIDTSRLATLLQSSS